MSKTDILSQVPESIMTEASIHAVTEVNSLGLHTTVQPVAIAGAILNVRRYKGRFQGEISPATPTGDCVV